MTELDADLIAQDSAALDMQKVDELVRDVAARLPFQTELFAEMDHGPFLQIDLGRRGGIDDPPDSASIDPTMSPVVWMLDVEGGDSTIESPHGLDADAQLVADWITTEARRVGSPAASSAAAVASMGFGSPAGSATRSAGHDAGEKAASRAAARDAAAPERGHESPSL